ncbi:hypothetical protein DFH27DRAFT_527895 [Peziza echinospora]|nr:hypothetical protein DFH27DRAFT_527895 [Peziza echinospora]
MDAHNGGEGGVEQTKAHKEEELAATKKLKALADHDEDGDAAPAGGVSLAGAPESKYDEEFKAKRKEEKKRRKAEAKAAAEAEAAAAASSTIGGTGSSSEQRQSLSPKKPILKSPQKKSEQISPLAAMDANTAKLSISSNSPPAPAGKKASKQKKSVKFSSDCAPEDGDSRERIHKAILGAYASAAIVTPEDLASSIEAAAPPSKKQKREKKKDGSKKKEKKLPGAKDANAKEGALSYLVEYHTNRESWKFQKAKQNWVLRNAFDVSEIEPTKEYSAALKAYITGLQGEDSRTRLLVEAKKIVANGDKAVSEPKTDGEGDVVMDAAAATATPAEAPPKPSSEAEVSRAKLVMSALGHGDDDEEEEEEEDKEASTDKEVGGTKTATTKADESDSEEEDSDEEDSDDSDAET